MVLLPRVLALYWQGKIGLVHCNIHNFSNLYSSLTQVKYQCRYYIWSKRYASTSFLFRCNCIYCTNNYFLKIILIDCSLPSKSILITERKRERVFSSLSLQYFYLKMPAFIIMSLRKLKVKSI